MPYPVDELRDERAQQVNDIKNLGGVLFLVEVALMFCSLFLGALWVSIVFHIIATIFAVFVLQTAYRAARVIPPSFPMQRPLGVVLYVSGHLMQFCIPGQLPIGLVAVNLIVCPLAIVLLFEP